MEKKTLIALSAVVALGVAAFFAMRAPEKGQRTGPPPRPIPSVKAADITGLEITSEKQEKATLALEAGSWRMKSPTDWPADTASVKQVTDALEKMTFADLVTEGNAKHGELGVEEAKAARVIAKDKSGKTLLDLHVGKSLGGFVMVRPAGKNEVWQSSGLFPYHINKEPKQWRDHTIFEFSANDAEKIVVESGGNKLALEKIKPEKKDGEGDKQPSTAETKWKVAEATGNAPKTSEALDAQQATQAVSAMAGLKATDFADGKKPSDVGLDKPVLRVTVTAAAKARTLEIGKTENEDTFVKAADSPTIYTLKKYALERLNHKPIDYRDKTVVKAKEVDLASVDITVAGQTTSLTNTEGKWTAKKGSVEESKVKPVVSGFENVAASSFAEEKDPATTGLGKPQGTVVLHLKDKSTVTLKIGNETKDKSDYYVQKVGSPDVFLVKKYAVDRFLKKPSDLSGATASAKK